MRLGSLWKLKVNGALVELSIPAEARGLSFGHGYINGLPCGERECCKQRSLVSKRSNPASNGAVNPQSE